MKDQIVIAAKRLLRLHNMESTFSNSEPEQKNTRKKIKRSGANQKEVWGSMLHRESESRYFAGKGSRTVKVCAH